MDKSQTDNAKRPAKKLDIYFGEEKTSEHGYIINLSLSGLKISGKKIFKPGTLLQLEIPNKEEPIKGEGTVHWASDEEIDSLPEMGIKFVDRPKNYAEFLEDILEGFDNKRIDPRFEKVFKIEFEKPQELVEEYCHNISKGGMFIVTNAPLEKDSVVDIHIHIEDILKIVHAEGKIVHRVSEKMAKEQGVKAGVGVMFIKFFDNDEEMFAQYINRLKSVLGED